MDKFIIDALSLFARDIYKDGNNKAFLIGDKAMYEIDYETALKVKEGQCYLTYNIKPGIYNKAVVKDFCSVYFIEAKVIDEKNNIILIHKGSNNIDLD